MTKNYSGIALIVAVLALVVGVGAYLASPAPQIVGGASGTLHTNEEHLLAGATFGTQSSASVFGFYQCATATVDPAAFEATTTGSGTATTSAIIAITGAVPSDGCIGSLSSASTSAVSVSCSIVGTGSSTLRIVNNTPGGSTLNLGSGTAKVCAFGAAR